MSTVLQRPELAPHEADALTRAEQLDGGRLAERLADAAHDVAYRAATTPDDLRQLAGLALTLARRSDRASELPDD
jgi:hypothetical protein